MRPAEGVLVHDQGDIAVARVREAALHVPRAVSETVPDVGRQEAPVLGTGPRPSVGAL